MVPVDKKHPPYVGVTGFMNQREVGRVYRAIQPDCPAKLMVGVLLSDKTLRGELNSHPSSFPRREDIANIFQPSGTQPLALNLLHYNTHDTSALYSQLLKAMQYGGPNCHGFQLNVAWPDREAIRALRMVYPGIVIVLQIGKQAFDMVHNDVGRLAQRLSIYYKDIIDYVLFDMSGGVGVPLNIELCRKYLDYLTRQNLHEYFGLGVAGGLSANSVSDVGVLFEDYPYLCMDAQGKLRDSEGNLNVCTAHSFVQLASRWYG